MGSSVKLNGCALIGNGIGIQLTGSADVEANDTLFKDNGIAILTEETPLPVELARAVIANLKASNDVATAKQTFGPDLKKNGFDIDKWIERGANAAAIITAVATKAGLGQ